MGKLTEEQVRKVQRRITRNNIDEYIRSAFNKPRIYDSLDYYDDDYDDIEWSTRTKQSKSNNTLKLTSITIICIIVACFCGEIYPRIKLCVEFC